MAQPSDLPVFRDPCSPPPPPFDQLRRFRQRTGGAEKALLDYVSAREQKEIRELSSAMTVFS